MAIIGKTEIIDSAGDQQDACAYTTGKIFNIVKRAFEAYDRGMLVVIDGKQKECVAATIATTLAIAFDH